jgi:putative hydrolase of the HAD superfamily
MYRVQQFKLSAFIDIFVSSCFVHYRKPDADIYRIALDIAQASPDQVVYIDDRAMFVEVARGLGIRGILHKDYETTQKALETIGLSLSDRRRRCYSKLRSNHAKGKSSISGKEKSAVGRVVS